LIRAALAAAVIALVCAAPAVAAPTLVKVGDFSSPVHVASPPGDQRVFVVEQGGLVKIAGGGTFLDATALTDGGGEQGLLSIAFSPNYVTTGLFYVFLTSNVDDALVVREYRRSADPNVADPASGRDVLRVPHPTPADNHNGGQLQFGPDGMLYVSTGDGGDTPNNAQNLASELGKILRIVPETGAPAPGNPNPASRVWAYGLRNPWRFSFDRATGDLVIGDVGQNDWEEVDWAPAAAGRGAGVNYGWPACEGFDCGTTGPFQPPAFARPQSAGYCAITGGYVVRDPDLPTLAGRYLYGDLCLSALRSTTLAGDDDRAEALPVSRATSFGEDACGRVYVTSHDGPVFRIEDGPPSPCVFRSLPTPTTPPAVDRTGPRVRFRILGLRTAARRRQLRLRMICNERCRATVSGRFVRVGRLRTVTRVPAANRRRMVRVRMSRRTAAKLGRTVRRRRVVVALAVRARDRAANESVVRRRAGIKKRPRGL
jgi:Glucose / Sorbosone dehydrogenase